MVLCAPGFPSSRDDSDKPFLLNHALALVSAGSDVTVVCPAVPGLPSRQTVEGVEVVRVRYAPRRFETLAATGSMYREARGLQSVFVLPMILTLILRVILESRKKKPLVVHGHWWVPGGFVAVVANFFVKTHSVVHLHGSDSVVANNSVMRWLARWVMRSATSCLAVSDALAEWGCEVSSRDVEVCPMPIAEEFGRRRKIPPPDGPIVGVGRLVREKGFDTLLRAVAQIEIADRPKLVIIGEGEEREALVYEADSLGVDLLLVGSLSPEKVADWYLEARFVVVPSRREGFGLVAAEAAACGRAVVGTRVGGLPELIEHKVSGLLVEADDEDELSEAIGSVELNWGSAGPERVVWLSKERHAQYLISLYSRLDSR